MHNTRQYRGIKKRVAIRIYMLFLLFSVTAAYAQDTVKTGAATDTVSLKKQVILHSPKKAAIYSTILPGLGQLYNKKYWKIPVLYAGIGGLTYAIIYNNNNYLEFRSAYRIRLDNDPKTIDPYADITSKDYLNDAELEGYTKNFHRWRDLSIFGAALLYVLNIVDATVDAHLFTFDVSDNLTMHLQPAWITTAGINNYKSNITGVSLRLNF